MVSASTSQLVNWDMMSVSTSQFVIKNLQLTIINYGKDFSLRGPFSIAMKEITHIKEIV